MKEIIDEKIRSILFTKPPSLLKEAMEYALFPGGKRLRPILCLLSCEAISGSLERALDVSVAIEFIHTYSLVHDDIIDQDEERRGRPSVYKKYGTPLALLVGDGFLTLGFEILSEHPLISKEVAKAIGIEGMILGQACEICKEKDLEFINLNKTGKLFSVSCVAGGIIGGGFKEQIEALRIFGANFGLCFQLKDDLIDKEISKGDYNLKIKEPFSKAESSLSIFKERGASLKSLLFSLF